MDQAAAADNVNWVTPSGTPWTTDGRRETAPTTFVNDDYYAAYTQDQASWTDPQAQQPQQRSNQPNGGGAAYPHGTMPNPAYPYIGQYYQQPSQSNGQSSSQPTPHHSPPQYPQTTQGQVFQPPQSSGFNGQPGALMSPRSFQHHYPGVPYPNYISPPPPQGTAVPYQQQQGSPFRQLSGTPANDYVSIAGPSSGYSQQPGIAQPYPVYANGSYSNILPNGSETSWINYEGLADGEGEGQNENEMVIDPSLTLLSESSSGPYGTQPLPATISPHALHARPQVIKLEPSPSPAVHVSRSRSSDSPQVEASSKQRRVTSAKPLDSAQLERLLDPEQLDSRPRESASGLFSLLAGDDPVVVDVPTRIKILQTVRDNAPGKFFEAWAKKLDAVDLLKGWLQDATAAKEKPATDVMMPLLQVIDRLPLTIDTLKETKIGKLIRLLTKSPPSTAIKDMATKLEQRWLQLAQSHDIKKEGSQGPSSDSKKRPLSAADEARKKRKLAEEASSKAPLKKAPVPSKVPAKPTKPGTSAAATVKDAKTDTSFFTSTKPKAPLPSFRKKPIAVTEVKKDPSSDMEEKPRAAPASDIDPFQEALKALNKKTGIGDKGTPPVESKPDVKMDVEMDEKKLKKRKSVTFATGDALVKVKLIEPAVYDDDEHDGEHHHMNLRDLDRAEGFALGHAVFDEQIDWYEPADMEFPPEISVFDRGASSQEKVTQESREGTVDEAFYEEPDQIPDSPTEISHLLPEIPENPLHVLRLSQSMMQVSPDDDGDLEPPKVADLLKRIGGDQTANALPASVANTSLAGIGIDPSLLASILANARGPGSQEGPSGQGMPPGFQPPPNDWQNQGPQEWMDDDGPRRGGRRGGGGGFRGESDSGWGGRARGGRGGGRRGGRGGKHEKGQRMIPCQFFQEGRCKFGDQCDYLHLDSFSQ